MDNEPRSPNPEDASHPPITSEDVDEYGLIIRIGGEDRFWLDKSENPEMYDYRVRRYLTPDEAAHRIRNLNIERPGSQELEE